MRFTFFDFIAAFALILQPVYIYWAYKLGKGESLNFKPVLCNKKDRENTKEEETAIKEWENILNYDGNKESQEEIDC